MAIAPTYEQWGGRQNGHRKSWIQDAQTSLPENLGASRRGPATFGGSFADGWLFGAAVCQVPLLDMRRYHLLLAGASWMGEYGDPDDPEQWAFIKTWSPYHTVRADASFPRTFFVTSTRDDRVHPGHERKMVARVEAQGHDVLYYENIEGGHGVQPTTVSARS